MFEYLKRFPFIDKKRYLYKTFLEENLDIVWWIKNIKNILELYGQGNLIQNIFKLIGSVISGNDYNPKHKSEAALKRCS